MDKTKLTSLQFACFIGSPILSLFSGLGTYNVIRVAGVDAWISVLIAFFLGILLFMLFLGIFNYKKELNITEKNNYLFGPYVGFVINFIINLLVFTFGMVILYNISNFAISQFLAETPIVIFMVLYGIVVIYNVSHGIENMSRVGIIFLAIIIFLTVISSIGLIPTVELSNIKPTLEHGIGNPLKGGILITLTNVVPIFLLLVVAKDKIIQQKPLTKHLFFFYALAFFFAAVAIFLTISSLGVYLCRIYQYPEYTVLKKISLFNFIERIENFIYVKWILNSFLSLSLIVYHISHSIKKDCKRLVPSLITLGIIGATLLVFKNNTVFYNMGLQIFPYLCLLLLFIYIIIGINILIRKLIEA